MRNGETRTKALARSSLLVGLVIVLGGLAVPGPSGAQSPANPAGDQTKVGIASGTAAADDEVVLPVSLSFPDGVRLWSVDLRLGSSKAQIAFGMIEPSGLADSVDVAVQFELKAGPGGDDSVLHASLSTITLKGSRLAIPTGPVAYVTFKVAKTAKAESVIPLTFEADVRSTDDPPRVLTPAVASKTKVTVASGAVFACFFYMH